MQGLVFRTWVENSKVKSNNNRLKSQKAGLWSTVLHLGCCYSVTESRPTPREPRDRDTPGLPVPHHLLEFAQVHVQSIGDAIQLSHPLMPSSALPSIFPSIRVFSCVGSSRQLAKILELPHRSFQWVFRVDFLYDWLVWAPCSPRDSQESFPAPQFESINSSGLCLLYGPALTTIRDHWEDQSLDYTDLSAFQHTVEVCQSFRTKNFSLSNLKHTVQLTALPLSHSWARQTYLLKPRDLIRSTKSLTGILSDSGVKNPPSMQEPWVRFPGGEEPWEKEMVTHSSILAWEIPHTEEPGGLQSMRLQKSWTYKSHLLAVWSWISYLSFLCSSFFIYWKWAISSVPQDYDKLRYLAHKETVKISYSSYCFLAVKLENYGSTIKYFAARYFLVAAVMDIDPGPVAKLLWDFLRVPVDP